ncbi:ankyrin repeat protein, partial [Metarhizium majus ARSEF 297]
MRPLSRRLGSPAAGQKRLPNLPPAKNRLHDCPGAPRGRGQGGPLRDLRGAPHRPGGGGALPAPGAQGRQRHSQLGGGEGVSADGADAEASRRSDRETPLMTACRGGNLDMVRLLVEAGADANNRFSRDGSTPVVLSAGVAHDEAVVLLMAHGGDPARRNRYGETALHLAARKDNLRLVRILLASGRVDVNAASVTRSTPLFEAIQVGNVQMVEVLLAYGASEEIYELNGGFVFTKALKSRGTGLMKALLELRIRPDVADAKGRTALSWAAEYGHAMQVEMLLESGAGVDTQDVQGKTPLMYAAVQARIQVMETLLDRGASLTTSDKYGMKAACHAVQSENWQSVGLILHRGEDVLCGAGRCAYCYYGSKL